MDTKLANELRVEWIGRGQEYGEMLRRQEELVAERVADPIHVPERPTQRERKEQGEGRRTGETRSHGAKVYARAL